MRILRIIGIIIVALVLLAIVFLNTIYRPFYQPCESMADWSIDVPMRCVKELG